MVDLVDFIELPGLVYFIDLVDCVDLISMVDLANLVNFTRPPFCGWAGIAVWRMYFPRGRARPAGVARGSTRGVFIRCMRTVGIATFRAADITARLPRPFNIF